MGNGNFAIWTPPEGYDHIARPIAKLVLDTHGIVQMEIDQAYVAELNDEQVGQLPGMGGMLAIMLKAQQVSRQEGFRNMDAMPQGPGEGTSFSLRRWAMVEYLPRPVNALVGLEDLPS